MPSAHKFRRALLEMSQAMNCQQRSLRPPQRCNLLIAPPPRLQPSPTLLLDAATQTFPHSASSADATTQLPLTEFFLGCTYSNDPVDRSVPPPTHGNASSSQQHQPHQWSFGPTRAAPLYATAATRSRGSSPPLSSSHGIPEKQRWCDPVRIHPPQLRPRSHMSVPPMREHKPTLQQPLAKEVKVPPSREPIMPSVQTHVRDVYLFQSLAPWYSPWSDLAIPNLMGLVTLIPLIVTSCIINTVSQLFSGTQTQRAETPPTSSQRLADGFMRLSFKKQAIMSLAHLRSVHCVHWQHGPRHLAQQGHL